MSTFAVWVPVRHLPLPRHGLQSLNFSARSTSLPQSKSDVSTAQNTRYHHVLGSFRLIIFQKSHVGLRISLIGCLGVIAIVGPSGPEQSHKETHQVRHGRLHGRLVDQLPAKEFCCNRHQPGHQVGQAKAEECIVAQWMCLRCSERCKN